jgi:peptidoglycan hydrolase-like protein with peptidoglycan-binding domain
MNPIKLISILSLSFFTFSINFSYAQNTTQQNYCPNLTYYQTVGSRDSRNRGETTKLQTFLKQHLNLNNQQFIATGHFGNLTKNYVKQFQKENGLIVTGIVGKVTRDRIALVCNYNEDNQTTQINANTTINQSTTQSNQTTNTNQSTTQSNIYNITTSNIYYYWTSGSWSSCNNNSQTRIVTCTSSLGSTVADSFCPATFRPSTTQACVVNTTNNTQTQTTTPACTPLPTESRTISCPSGQTGSITESRTSTCPSTYGSPQWSNWTAVTNTCTNITTTNQSSTVGSCTYRGVVYQSGQSINIPNVEPYPVQQMYVLGYASNPSYAYFFDRVIRLAIPAAPFSGIEMKFTCSNSIWTFAVMTEYSQDACDLIGIQNTRAHNEAETRKLYSDLSCAKKYIEQNSYPDRALLYFDKNYLTSSNRIIKIATKKVSSYEAPANMCSSYSINWGDGSVENVANHGGAGSGQSGICFGSWNQQTPTSDYKNYSTHTYVQPGNYMIQYSYSLPSSPTVYSNSLNVRVD